MAEMDVILTPDQRVRVFISSTLEERQWWIVRVRVRLRVGRLALRFQLFHPRLEFLLGRFRQGRQSAPARAWVGPAILRLRADRDARLVVLPAVLRCRSYNHASQPVRISELYPGLTTFMK
jgi:hypothetical protein